MRLTTQVSQLIILSVMFDFFINANANLDSNQNYYDNPGIAITINSVYEFKSKTLLGKHEIPLSVYAGKIMLITNIAHNDTLAARNFRDLQRLHEEFGRKGDFLVLGYPCQQFDNAGYDDVMINSTIAAYNLTFPVMAKVKVIGEQTDRLWRYLGWKSGNRPMWNFYKYLIDEHGRVIQTWDPSDFYEAMHEEIRTAVERVKLQQQMERPFLRNINGDL